MRTLDNLKLSPYFKLYPDSSQNFISFSDLSSELLLKTLRGHENILVERYYRDRSYLYLYRNEALVYADFYGGDWMTEEELAEEKLFCYEDIPLTYTKTSVNASYSIIGCWKGELE